MLVCQCNVITDQEIRDTVLGFLRDDPWAIIVPARVYRELGKRRKCSGCVPNVVDIIMQVTQNYHVEIARDRAGAQATPARPAALRQERDGGDDERRRPGHRAA